ncbi:hypothetical protein EON73_04040 [bacterium]|nr:MAG: hypothetical protein EON73_04040 [bacterium]
MRKLYIIIIVAFASCKQQVRNETQVYNNNFESNNLSNITNGTLSKFNGSTVLGRYNNGSAIITINNLPEHDLVTITFDLYIHDSWEGNMAAPDGPDIWEMLVDGNPYINTTFSNLACGTGVFCPPQSYPSDYPNSNHNPKAGAFATVLPGFCSQINNPTGTTQYKIERTITHSNKNLTLQCLDKLVQTNVADPLCDESWSIDNVVIKTVKL